MNIQSSQRLLWKCILLPITEPRLGVYAIVLERIWQLCKTRNLKPKTQRTWFVMWTVNEVQNYTALKRRLFIVDRWEISTEKSNVRGHQGSQWIDGTTFNLHWFDGTTTCISIDGTCFALVAQLLKPDIVWGRTHLTSTIEKIPYWNWSKFEEKNLSSFAFYCLETKHLKPHKNIRNKT